MRFLSTLLLGMVALATPSDAVQMTAQHKLQRLTTRILPAHSSYSFDGYWTDANSANAAVTIPANSFNILLLANNARANPVLTRRYSPTRLDSRVEIPVGLSASYTVGVWVSWSGTSNAAGQNIIISSTDGRFRVYVNDQGKVCAGYDGSCLVSTPTSLPTSIWQHITVSYSAGTGQLILYLNGVSQSTGTSIGFNGASKLSLLNLGTNGADNGFVGAIDDVRIFTSTLTDTSVTELFTTTRTGVVPATSTDDWYGHFSSSRVQFASRTMSQPTGDIRITVTMNDAEFRTTNKLYIRLYGVSGTTVSNLVVPDVGTVGWDTATQYLTIKPAKKVELGETLDITIPGHVLNLNNPTLSGIASDSDARWSIAVALEQDQTGGRRQGLRYQQVTYTPETINPNPSLLESDSISSSLLELMADSVSTDCSTFTTTSTCETLTSLECGKSKVHQNGEWVPCQLTLGDTCFAAYHETCN